MIVSGLEQKAALIRFYFGQDFKSYNDDFFKAWGQLEYSLIFEKKLSKTG